MGGCEGEGARKGPWRTRAQRKGLGDGLGCLGVQRNYDMKLQDLPDFGVPDRQHDTAGQFASLLTCLSPAR